MPHGRETSYEMSCVKRGDDCLINGYSSKLYDRKMVKFTYPVVYK